MFLFAVVVVAHHELLLFDRWIFIPSFSLISCEEAAPPPPPEAPQQVATQVPDESIPEPQMSPENTQEEAPSDPNLQALDAANEAEPVKFSDIETDGPQEGEYEKIIF